MLDTGGGVQHNREDSRAAAPGRNRKGVALVSVPDIPTSGANNAARAARRRRRKNVAGGRTHSHQVVVSPEEELKLQAKADELGVSIPRLLIESALSPAVRTLPERRANAAALLSAMGLLGAISRNVNQLAKAANTTGEVSEDLQATLSAVRRVGDRVSGLAEELMK